MKKAALVLSLILFLFSTKEINAEVLINEFVPDSSTEWVEIYNSGLQQVDLSQYRFDDDTVFGSDAGNSAMITLSGILNAASLCYWDLSTFLNNDGDSPTIFRDNGDVQDTYTYTSPSPDKSYSRVPDGSTWQPDQTPTKASTSCLSLAPTASPTVTPTATPTSTPTSTPTASPTQKPAPTKSPTPKPAKSPTPEPEQSKETDVLGLRDSLKTPTPSPTGIPEASSGKQIPLVAGLMIGGGSIFVAIPGVWFLRQRKLYNDHTSENTQ